VHLRSPASGRRGGGVAAHEEGPLVTEALDRRHNARLHVAPGTLVEGLLLRPVDLGVFVAFDHVADEVVGEGADLLDALGLTV